MKTVSKSLPILIIICTIYWSFYEQIPSLKKGNIPAKEQVFSIEKALKHIKSISHQPHFTGSKEHKKVQSYLVNELENLGLETAVQKQTVFNKKSMAGATVENVIATIKGSRKGKSLLLLTHYDSNPHSSLGASDAGSGVATILEGLRAFLKKNQQPKNDIIIMFSDAEELDLLGAEAFVNHHPLAENIGLVLNFEARGSGGSSYILLETNGKNSTLLNAFLSANPKNPSANSLMYSVYKLLPNDTDLTVFREQKNISGFNFAFIDDHFDYHTAQDTFDRLDRNSLLHQADYLMAGLHYFSNADLSNFNSTEDHVFINFPFIKLLTYPFSWIGYMLVIAIFLFLLLVFVGLKRGKLTLTGIFKGFIPFLISLVACSVVSFLLWKILLVIHPQYQDILHGFTYNGYEYMAAFIFLSISILITVYNVFKNEKIADLVISPIIIWLVINFLMFLYLKGGGFFMIPVFFALFAIAFLVFGNIEKKNQPILFAVLSMPTMYIFAPLIKLFPVGLGLKNLFISAILVVLIFGLIIPIFHVKKKKNFWFWLFGLLTFFFFFKATYNSGFSIDNKKPNSLVYVQNDADNVAYWATYNKTIDTYTKQIFDKDYVKASIADVDLFSKYNTPFSFQKKTTSKNIKKAIISKVLDTIINDNRHLEIIVHPQRKVNKYTILNNTTLNIKSLKANNILIYEDAVVKKENLLRYYMASTDETLVLELICDKNDQLDMIVNEISFDLLRNTNFTLTPRSKTMMPMPFVTNDAIICVQRIAF